MTDAEESHLSNTLPTNGKSSNGVEREKRKRIAPRTVNPAACTNCRQSKLRCEPGDGDGSQCRRCQRLRLPCQKDNNFVRASKSRRIHDLEEQVQRLSTIVSPLEHSKTSILDSSESPHYRLDILATSASNAPAIPYDTPSGNPYRQTSVSILPRPAEVVHIDWDTELPKSERPKAQTPRSISRISLSISQIDTLFALYFDHYHPFLPLLDSSKAPDQYFEDHESLFWVIISVAARRYAEDVTILAALQKPVLDLIWKAIASPPYTLWMVTAMLIISTWPFPAMIMNHNQGLTLSAVTLTASKQVGLHRPKLAHEFRQRVVIDDQEIQLRTKTWAAVHIVSQNLCLSIGITSFAPFDWVVDQACLPGNEYSLLSEMRIQLTLARFCHQVDNAVDQPNGFSEPVDAAQLHASIELWTDEINTLERNIEEQGSGTATATARSYLDFARLYSQAAAFLDPSATPIRRYNVLAAYDAARAFIIHCPETTIIYGPENIQQRLTLAAWIIFKVLRSSYTAYISDVTAGRKAYTNAISLLAKCSVENNDVSGRATKYLTQIWNSDIGLHATGSEVASNPEVENEGIPLLRRTGRLIASIFYDFLWTSREHFAGQVQEHIAPQAIKHTVKPIPTSNTPSSTSASANPYHTAATTFQSSNVDFSSADLAAADAASYPTPVAGLSTNLASFLDDNFGFDFWADPAFGFVT